MTAFGDSLHVIAYMLVLSVPFYSHEGNCTCKQQPRAFFINCCACLGPPLSKPLFKLLPKPGHGPPLSMLKNLQVPMHAVDVPMKSVNVKVPLEKPVHPRKLEIEQKKKKHDGILQSFSQSRHRPEQAPAQHTRPGDHACFVHSIGTPLKCQALCSSLFLSCVVRVSSSCHKHMACISPMCIKGVQGANKMAQDGCAVDELVQIGEEK
eukprot:1143202-Pelagomonas_calceolata.AAC.8